MKLGVMNPVLYSMSLEKAVEYLSKLGVQVIEIGVGGYPGKNHVDAKDYLDNPSKIEDLKQLLEKNNLEISALSCHGNPIHPNKEIAKVFHDDFIDAILLAQKLGVDTIVGFSGCPGDSEGSSFPNWVTCSWPEDYHRVLEYQWNDVLIPYWKKTALFAKEHGIKKIAFEMHPGFCVYNPETLLKLRNEVGGDIIGANFDPSHLFWQGINPVEAIKYLKGAIHYFHAKDTHLDQHNLSVNGVLDTKHYADQQRSWVFRTVGYGHDSLQWKEMISTLRQVGYDDIISIEHEDALMSSEEGLIKAIEFLKDIMMFDKPGEMFWA